VSGVGTESVRRPGWVGAGWGGRQAGRQAGVWASRRAGGQAGNTCCFAELFLCAHLLCFSVPQALLSPPSLAHVCRFSLSGTLSLSLHVPLPHTHTSAGPWPHVSH
jgi:hypothetical protein